MALAPAPRDHDHWNGAVALKDPRTYQAIPGGGVGPWFATYGASKTGEVFARNWTDSAEVTWDRDGRHHAATWDRPLRDGEVIDLHGFAWTVCTVRDLSSGEALIAADPNIDPAFAALFGKAA